MSKLIFASILKGALPDTSIVQVSGYWDMALKANLPNRIFDLIVPQLYRLPLIHEAYCEKRGFSPLVMSEDQARRLILELLIEGPRYMSEIQKLFSIPAEMRRDVLASLVEARIVQCQFCPIGNCMAYELSPVLRVPKKVECKIDQAMSWSESISLYRLSLSVASVDYSVLCEFTRSILNNGSHKYAVEFHQGKVVICHKDLAIEKA